MYKIKNIVIKNLKKHIIKEKNKNKNSPYTKFLYHCKFKKMPNLF